MSNMSEMAYQQPKDQYVSGLEVAGAETWHHSASLPEVAPPGTWDKDTYSTPEVAHPPPQTPYSVYGGSQFSPDGSNYPQTPYHQTPPSLMAMQEEKEMPVRETICGIRKKVFYIVLGIGIVVVVAAIAIGVGAGIALGKDKGKGKDTSTTEPPPVLKPESTADAIIQCPAAENKTFVNEAENRVFRVHCGIDYNGEDGAVDLTSVDTLTMGACIDECANRPDCVGAGWGIYFGTHVCFMKSALGNKNRTPAWYFAIDEASTEGTT